MYDRLVKLADDHLDDPTTAEITTYAGGTFKIRVFHRRSLDEREVLQYHSKYGDVRRAVVSDETIVAEREIPLDGGGGERCG